MKRTVLIAVNASEHSRRALDWYLDRIRIDGDQVLFAHVVETEKTPLPTYAHGPSLSRDDWDIMIRNMEEKAHIVTEPFERRLEEYMGENEGKTSSGDLEKIEFRTIYSPFGNVAEAICKMAEDNNVDMIIIGNRGLGSIRRTLLGSVCDCVIQQSCIPVVVVPPPVQP